MPDDSANNVQTLIEVFLDRVDRDAAGEATRHRRGDTVVSTTWAEWARRSRVIAAGLVELGLRRGDRVAILSHTRVEWMWVDIGVMMAGGITVPIFPTEVASGVAVQLADSGARIVVVEDAEQLAKVQAVRGELTGLEATFCLEPERPGLNGDASDAIAAGAGGAAEPRTLEELADIGEAALAAHRAEIEGRMAAVLPRHVATIHYTAGTQGAPKGVQLTHGGFVRTAAALAERLPVGREDLQLLYLPLAQPFARLCLAVAMHAGVTTSIARSYRTVLEDARLFQPTFLCGVPRLFEGIRRRTLAEERDLPGVQRRMFEVALAVARRRADPAQRKGVLGRVEAEVAERLVFGPARAVFGGRLRFAICGGAPLAFEAAEWFRERGLELLEGYGMTETCACTHINTLENNRLGTVGQALPVVETRLLEDGELLVRGPNITPGYWGQPELSAETIDADGWLHTGDLGAHDADGFLTITDRKRDVIITANGKAIAPGPIVERLRAEPLVDQVLVHGDRRDYLTALVTLDRDALAAFAEQQSIDDASYEDLARHSATYAVVEAAVERVNATLPRHESIRKFAILATELTADAGELTATRRLRRQVASERHRALLDSFYSERY